MIGLVLRTLTGKRCRAKHPVYGTRCVFDAGHARGRDRRQHGAPAGFGYRWWK